MKGQLEIIVFAQGCGGPLRTSVLENLQGASIAGIILALLEVGWMLYHF